MPRKTDLDLVASRIFFSRIADEVPDEVVDGIRQRGGVTLYPDTLESYEDRRGYGVALKAPGVILDSVEQMSPLALEAYLRHAKAYFEDPANFFGVWIDDTDGKVYLDVTVLVDDRDEAIDLGRAEDQLAIWDYIKQEEIRL